jgi:hypothetical protein
LANIGWTALSFTARELVIQLDFLNPLEVSSGSERDSLAIKIVKPSFFIYADDLKIAIPGNLLNSAISIPPQYPNEEAKIILENVQETVASLTYLNILLAILL